MSSARRDVIRSIRVQCQGLSKAQGDMICTDFGTQAIPRLVATRQLQRERRVHSHFSSPACRPRFYHLSRETPGATGLICRTTLLPDQVIIPEQGKHTRASVFVPDDS